MRLNNYSDCKKICHVPAYASYKINKTSRFSHKKQDDHFQGVCIFMRK